MASESEHLDITFDSILSRFNTYIETEGVDPEVWVFYSNILRSNTLIPLQCAYLAKVHHLALQQAYIRRRQLRREELTKTKKFHATLKCWILEIKDLDVSRQLPGVDSAPSLTVRVSVEGQVKGTTKIVPTRAYNGEFEPVKISQDVEFFIKRPTSLIHLDVIHINDDEPDGSLEREVLVGSVIIPLRNLESQKMLRQWYNVMWGGQVVAEMKTRIQYTFKEDIMHKWDVEAGFCRPISQGGPNFHVGIIGVGHIGTHILDSLLKSGYFKPANILTSTRRPEKLSHYEKLGITIGSDSSMVASKADVLIIACQPNNLTQVASAVRDRIRQETLVISLVAGVSADRAAKMFHVSTVMKPRVGTETGLPVPEEPKPFKLTKKQERNLTAGEKILMEEELRNKQREAQLSAHAQTSFRALFSDGQAVGETVEVYVRLLETLGLTASGSEEVVQGALCNAVPELMYYGEDVELEALEAGERVKILPGGTDVDERFGVVRMKIPDDRNEYIVVVNGKDVRAKRNRIVSAEAKLDQPEEGYSVLEGRVVSHDDLLNALADFYKTVTERAMGLRPHTVPADEVAKEKSGPEL